MRKKDKERIYFILIDLEKEQGFIFTCKSLIAKHTKLDIRTVERHLLIKGKYKQYLLFKSDIQAVSRKWALNNFKKKKE